MQSLTKGANAPVAADAVGVALTWTTSAGGPDVDVSALLCGPDGAVGSDDDFVFFNQPHHPSGSVRHRGKRGTTTTADILEVELGRVPASVERVVIVASTDVTFGRVPDLALSLLAADGATVLLRFAIDADAETALVAGELYRRGGAWKFRAIGQGYTDGLAGLARDYGITVDDPGPTQGATHGPTATTTPHPAPTALAVDWLNPPVPAGYEI